MKTHEYLKITEDHYQLIVMDWYTSYCAQKSANDRQCQMLLCNQQLFSWWRHQLAMIEEDFKEEIRPYLDTVTAKDALLLYAKNTSKLALYYNTDLIKAAIKQVY